LVAVTAAALFLAALIIASPAGSIPAFATAPALVYVACLMMVGREGGEIRGHNRICARRRHDRRHATDLFIAHGIAFGFISYTGIKVLSGRWRDLTVAILAILFALKFSFFEALQWAMNRNVLASASAVLQGAARELGFGISVLALKLEQLPLCSRS
jgi:adenine/guanine/hypoxanthine permease